MSAHIKTSNIIITDSANQSGKRDIKSETLSRRGFIRNAAGGVAGAAFTLGGLGEALAKSKESGQIMLDGLLITFFTAPVGTTGELEWDLDDSYSTSLRLNSPVNPDISFRAKTSSGSRIFMGHAIKQSNSSQLSKGITLRHKGFDGVTRGSNFEAVATADDTLTFGILRPRLQIDGGETSLRFRFLDAEASFIIPIKHLRNDNTLFNPDTVASWIDQYVTDPVRLRDPRFFLLSEFDRVPNQILHASFAQGAGNLPVLNQRTATTTATIITSDGFQSDAVKQALAVGNKLEITYGSTQEFSGRTALMDARLRHVSRGVNKVYWDHVFKNFIVADA